MCSIAFHSARSRSNPRGQLRSTAERHNALLFMCLRSADAPYFALFARRGTRDPLPRPGNEPDRFCHIFRESVARAFLARNSKLPVTNVLGLPILGCQGGHTMNATRAASRPQAAKRRQAHEKTRLELESLEQRLVPSASVYVDIDSAHNVHIQGSSGNDRIEIRYQTDGDYVNQVTIGALDSNTTIAANGFPPVYQPGHGFVLARGRLLGDLDIDLGGGQDL